MTDHLSDAERSRNMSRIHGKDTTPEHCVRKLLHGLGLRFRLHRSDLPGKPDIVLPRYKTIVFVNGCYWHRHEGCLRGQSVPSKNRDSWIKKFENNIQRDRVVEIALADIGWRKITIWECELKPGNLPVLEARLRTLFNLEPAT